MAYSLISEVRRLCKLITADTVPDLEVVSFINDSDNYIDLWLGDLFEVPLKSNELEGSISIVPLNKNVLGDGTTFIKNLRKKRINHIVISNTDELLQIDHVISEITLTLIQEIDPGTAAPTTPTFSATDSKFYILPNEINLASKYLAANLIIQKHFSKEAFNQEADQFRMLYETFGEKIINKMEKGSYYNSILIPQTKEQTNARNISIVSTEQLTQIHNFINEVNTWP